MALHGNLAATSVTQSLKHVVLVDNARLVKLVYLKVFSYTQFSIPVKNKNNAQF